MPKSPSPSVKCINSVSVMSEPVEDVLTDVADRLLNSMAGIIENSGCLTHELIPNRNSDRMTMETFFTTSKKLNIAAFIAIFA